MKKAIESFNRFFFYLLLFFCNNSALIPVSYTHLRKLVIAALACIALQASVILIPPLSAVFKTAHLGILQWAIVIGLALVPIVVVEIEKLLFRMIRALFPPKEKSHKKVNKKEAKQL